MKLKSKKLALIAAVVACLGMSTVSVSAATVSHNTVTVAQASKSVKSVEITSPTTSSKYTLGKGKKVKLSVKVTGTAKNKDVTFSSSNSKVVKVSKSGWMQGVSKGTATIKVKSKANPKKYDTIKVTVKSPVSKLSASNVYVAKGSSKTISKKVSPSSASTACKYSSSNKSIATVSSKGVVKGVKAGTCEIKITALDGSKKSVTIKVTVTSVSLKDSSCEVIVANPNGYRISATTKPSSVASKGFTYTTSDSSIATVSSKGYIYAKKPGDCTIKVAAKDGSKAYAVLKLKVRQYASTKVVFKKGSSSVLTSGVSWKDGKTLYNDLTTVVKASNGKLNNKTFTIQTADKSYTAAVSSKGVLSIKDGSKDVTSKFSSSVNKEYKNVKFVVNNSELTTYVSILGDAAMSGKNTLGSSIKIGNDEITKVTSDGYYIRGVLNGKTNVTAFVYNGNLYIVGNKVNDANFASLKKNAAVEKLEYTGSTFK